MIKLQYEGRAFVMGDFKTAIDRELDLSQKADAQVHELHPFNKLLFRNLRFNIEIQMRNTHGHKWYTGSFV